MGDGTPTGSKKPRVSEVLILTNIRTFQQDALESRRKHKGRPTFTQSIPPKFCGRHSYIAITNDDKGSNFKLHKIYCKLYRCPRCQKVLAEKNRQLLKQVIELNHLDHLLTLTLDPKKVPVEYLNETENHTHKYITKLFNKFVLYIKRKINKSVKYVWVCEFQKNGNAHLHVVLNCYLPIKVIKFEWKRIGGGHDMGISKVESFWGVANYLVKYLVKGFKNDENIGFRQGERRITISHSCIRSPRTVIKHIGLSDISSILSNLDAESISKVYDLLEDKKIKELREFKKMYNTSASFSPDGVPELSVNGDSLPLGAVDTKDHFKIISPESEALRLPAPFSRDLP